MSGRLEQALGEPTLVPLMMSVRNLLGAVDRWLLWNPKVLDLVKPAKCFVLYLPSPHALVFFDAVRSPPEPFVERHIFGAFLLAKGLAWANLELLRPLP